jgi:deoxyribonuclease-4
VNLASTNNRIRIPSRKLVQQHAEAAAEVGAAGLVVHGGHVTAGEDPAVGVDNWRKFFARQRAEHGGFAVPILIENTAGGDHAMARRFDALARLWDAVGEFDAGFCLDTCHAFAGGEDLTDVVDRAKSITGRIDLVHLNNSRDEFNSARDRHANIAAGTIDADQLVAVAASAGAPVVVETPAEGQPADIAYLRERLG